MSNSSLVNYKKLSPNNSGKRDHSIDRITPHCVVGQLTVERLGAIFANASYKASCNYAIGTDGRVALIVDESMRSWCSSSNANDQRAVTIECASDLTSPYAFNSKVYNKLIDLCVDICKRNGKTKLIWIDSKSKALAYEPKDSEMLLTVHRWFANKACPGDWMMARMGDLAGKVTAKLSGSASTQTAVDIAQYYRVRKTWQDAESQKGAYSIIANARAEADKWNGTYGVFDWNGKEVYRPEKKAVKDPEIFNYWPCWPRKTSPDDRRGSGTVFIDENGNCVVYDAFVENSVPCEKLITYMKKHDVTHYTAIGSHAHMDHVGGFFSMLKEKGLIMDMLVCYDPDSLKLAGSGSANARSVRDDKAYLQKLISKVKAAGAKIRYVVTGDKLSVGQMNFKFYRKQPTAFGDQDNGQAYGYMNHGSLAIYNYELGTLYSADGPKSGADMLEYFKDEDVEVVDSEHHGNGAGKTYAQSMKKRGVVLCIEANNEKNGPGSCEFTSFGSRRIIEAGVTVWMLNASVYGHAKNGTVTWKQTGKKTITYDTEFGRKAETPAAKTDQEKFIEKIGAMAKADMAQRGICAAITIAQAILESGWGKSELAQNANNLFGMKKSLSGNTWPGSSWDGKSVYSKQTKEVYASGPATVQADFRAYKTLQESVNDHSAYLAGARNGSALRYKGLVGCTDYKKAAQIIKAGGYATAPDYVEKLCRLVEQYGLTRYNTTYKEQATEAAAKTPYTVKVSTQIPILKTPAGTKVKTCPKGIYTIVEEKNGYGHLKSGAGWIQLSKTNKV